MARSYSYIGIVTHRGLRALYRENDHVVRFLSRRLARGKCPGGLVWAVLDDDAAQFVEVLLALGEMHAALGSLEAHADYYGPVIPDFVELPQHHHYLPTVG